MASDKLKLNIIDIPGVSIRRTNEAVEFCFLKPLNYDEWHGIENVIIQMQKTGSSHFIFDLQRVSQFCSIDIGMWVTLNTTIEKQSGKCKFVLGSNSTLHQYIKLAKLDKIFSIYTKDTNQDSTGGNSSY
jgi:hypothetical protein